jgi:hypothetical protein
MPEQHSSDTPRSASRPRPSFNSAWAAFKRINVSVPDVGKKLGGRVEWNINIPDETKRFENAYPIRMSYVLNYTGFPIARSHLYHMVSGADHKWYIHRIPDMEKYLEVHLSKPDKIVTEHPKTTDFSGMRGILLVRGATNWRNAQGHATLWDGTECADDCHLADEDNRKFVPGKTSLWILQ